MLDSVILISWCLILAIFALGVAGIFSYFRQSNLDWSSWYGSWSSVFLLGGCISDPTEWQEIAQDTTIFVSKEFSVSYISDILINLKLIHWNFRKNIFDEPQDDADYQMLPEEDRPGGFNWGERANRPAEDNNAQNN